MAEACKSVGLSHNSTSHSVRLSTRSCAQIRKFVTIGPKSISPALMKLMCMQSNSPLRLFRKNEPEPKSEQARVDKVWQHSETCHAAERG